MQRDDRAPSLQVSGRRFLFCKAETTMTKAIFLVLDEATAAGALAHGCSVTLTPEQAADAMGQAERFGAMMFSDARAQAAAEAQAHIQRALVEQGTAAEERLSERIRGEVGTEMRQAAELAAAALRDRDRAVKAAQKLANENEQLKRALAQAQAAGGGGVGPEMAAAFGAMTEKLQAMPAPSAPGPIHVSVSVPKR
jgi:hypothetical protein